MSKILSLEMNFGLMISAGLIAAAPVASQTIDPKDFKCQIKDGGLGNYYRQDGEWGEYAYLDKNGERQTGVVFCIPEASRFLCGKASEKDSPHKTAFYFDWEFKTLTRVEFTLPKSADKPPKFTEYKISCK